MKVDQNRDGDCESSFSLTANQSIARTMVVEHGFRRHFRVLEWTRVKIVVNIDRDELLLDHLEYQTTAGPVDRSSDGCKPRPALKRPHDRAGSGG
jgi:hypothetical protein